MWGYLFVQALKCHDIVRCPRAGVSSNLLQAVLHHPPVWHPGTRPLLEDEVHEPFLHLISTKLWLGHYKAKAFVTLDKKKSTHLNLISVELSACFSNDYHIITNEHTMRLWNYMKVTQRTWAGSELCNDDFGLQVRPLLAELWPLCENC